MKLIIFVLSLLILSSKGYAAEEVIDPTVPRHPVEVQWIYTPEEVKGKVAECRASLVAHLIAAEDPDHRDHGIGSISSFSRADVIDGDPYQIKVLVMCNNADRPASYSGYNLLPTPENAEFLYIGIIYRLEPDIPEIPAAAE